MATFKATVEIRVNFEGKIIVGTDTLVKDGLMSRVEAEAEIEIAISDLRNRDFGAPHTMKLIELVEVTDG